MTLLADRLREIVQQLVRRPGHEKVRALLHELLVHGLDIPDDAVRLETYLGTLVGFADGLCGRTVFEIKSDLRRETGSAEEELARYLPQLERETGGRCLGIATDGHTWVPYRLMDGQPIALPNMRPVPDSPQGLIDWLRVTAPLLAPLRPTPGAIRTHLGRDSLTYAAAAIDLRACWSEVEQDASMVLRRRLWAGLLAAVYGAEPDDLDTLWLQHTYLVIIAKSLASRALGMPADDPEALLTGRSFSDAGIHWAMEADFFSWVLEAPAGSAFVQRLISEVERFQLDAVEHDVLKGLYESLIDPEQRHLLGEYYTPDWLCRRMVEQAITSPLNQRVLDPACGSGSFLFSAVEHVLSAASAAGMKPEDALNRAMQLVIGVDIHPVAVIIARATYLLACMRVLPHRRGPLSLPVYLGDSLQWNTEVLVGQRRVEVPVPGGAPLVFPADVAKNLASFDRVVTAMLLSSARGDPAAVFEAWLVREEQIDARDQPVLSNTYARLAALVRAGEDHIWGYVARNLVRPVWLSGEDERPDVIIGNPPWLSYRRIDPAMQVRFRQESKRLGLWHGGAVATQDLSGIFFARCVELYLREGGALAFVLPYAALIGRSYAGLRAGQFADRSGLHAHTRIDEVWVLGDDLQPLFPVPACVIFAQRSEPGPWPSMGRIFSGHLPRRDATPAEAEHALSERVAELPSADGRAVSVYAARFRQGATLVPRVLFRVEMSPTGRLGGNPAAPVVRSVRTNQEKAPWAALPRLEGPVEVAFVRNLYLSESILPFRALQPATALVPWGGDPPRVLSADSAAREGAPHLAAWLDSAERIWNEHRRNAMTFAQKADYFGELTAQIPIARCRVVYTRSGTLPAAAVLEDRDGIVDFSLYWAGVESQAEGDYLAAILSSETARAMVADRQSRGQWGARDFAKVMLSLPIAEFDPARPLHAELSRMGRKASDLVAELTIPPNTYFTAGRRRAREALTASGIGQEIERIVGVLLTESPARAPHPSRREIKLSPRSHAGPLR